MNLFFKNLAIGCALVLGHSVASAYIPSTRVILEKTVENSGSASYQIEREVRFSNAEIPTLKETWYIENDRTMRLTVVPISGPITTQLGLTNAKLTILYLNGTRYTFTGTSKESSKVPEEMLERLFHFRRTDHFAQLLAQLRVLSGTQGNLDLAKLNRSQGVVNFGIGRPTEEGNKPVSPYIWIEQDAFVIRKLRFSDEAEVTASQYQIYPKGLLYPGLMNLSWADQKVKLATSNVIMTKKFQPTVFQVSSLEDSRAFQTGFSRWNAVTEFYQRFR